MSILDSKFSKTLKFFFLTCDRSPGLESNQLVGIGCQSCSMGLVRLKKNYKISNFLGKFEIKIPKCSCEEIEE